MKTLNQTYPFTALALGLVLATGITSAHARQCSVQSPAYTLALVEVYTSQGCSSCPPADRWLSQLAKLPNATKSVVALALHVDYWDYIGWKDPFAQASFTQRQRAWSRTHRARGVYTPQVVLGGADYREWWQTRNFANDVAKINQLPAQANIEVSLSDAMSIRVAANARLPEASELYVAVYENKLNTAVKRGENAGEKLANDRVVRYWSGPIALVNGAALIERQNLAIDRAEIDNLPTQKRDMGIAAFVQTKSGKILQATSCEL